MIVLPALKRQPNVLRAWPARLPFYYGWVNVCVAAVTMTATLPGRTHGLGMISKPLTEDASLGLSEVAFSSLNFWAILLGSLLCLPAGRWIDRYGARGVLVAVTFGLGIAVFAMGAASGVTALFVALVLVRGLGQGALSVVSMALVGKWFTRRLAPAMGVYTVLLAVGFISATVALGAAVNANGWRAAWSGMGWMLILGLVPAGWLLARSTPEEIGISADVDCSPAEADASPHSASRGLRLMEALRTPQFWVFTLCAALFNLMWSAITLFNESILNDHGLDNETFILVMAVLVFSGLPTNLAVGWLCTKWPMSKVLAIGMFVLAISLAVFPWVATSAQAMAYAALLGVAGGVVTVVFFAAYGHAFGRSHLGAIQAVVQIVTVLASAIGPVLLTTCKSWTGSYDGMFPLAAAAAAALGACSWLVRSRGV